MLYKVGDLCVKGFDKMIIIFYDKLLLGGKKIIKLEYSLFIF